MKISNEKKERVKQFLLTDHNLTTSQIAAKFCVGERTIGGWKSQWVREGIKFPTFEKSDQSVQQKLSLDDQLIVKRLQARVSDLTKTNNQLHERYVELM